MITKKALLQAICDLDKDVAAIAVRLHKLEKSMGKKAEVEPKRKPGRPRKNTK